MNRKLSTAGRWLALLSVTLLILSAAYFRAAGAGHAAPSGLPSPAPQSGFLPAIFGQQRGPTATATPVTQAESTATPTPTETPTETPTATPSMTPTPTTAPETGPELLVFDWNGPVTVKEHGFPADVPPLANGDWTQPVNYADGTLYLRAQIRSQPVPQEDMQLQFCIWQYGIELETCTALVIVAGTAGNVVTWSVSISEMWKKDGQPLEWSEPREWNAVAIKNGEGDPVSDNLDWEWSGENPDDWYPLDMRFTIVVVEKGALFSGWDNYIP